MRPCFKHAATLPSRQVWNFIDWFRNETAGADKWRSLPEYFRAHGYTTLGLGKTFHGCFEEVPPWSLNNATASAQPTPILIGSL